MDNVRLRRAMTLIELTVALALSVLLVSITGGVLKSMVQKKKVFADRLDVPLWRLELAERLRDDLCRSKEMRIGGRIWELSGFGGHDIATGEPVQMPVNIVWKLKELDGQCFLIRIERPVGGIEEYSAVPRIELAAAGIKSIGIGTFAGMEYEDKEEPQTITADELSEKAAGDWTAVPQVLKVVVHGVNNEVLIDELIFR